MEIGPLRGNARGWGVALLLATPGMARAHLPHDNVYGVAAPASLDGSQPWVATVYSGMVGSTDGVGWVVIGGSPAADELSAAAQLPDGRSVLLGEQGLWASEDGGSTWTLEPLVGALDLVVHDDQLYVAGDFGVLAGPSPDALVRTLADVEAVALSGGSSGVAAIDRVGAVWTHSDPAEAWTRVFAPAPATAALAGSVLWVGDDQGVVWYLDDGWQSCGSLPTLEHPRIMGLAETTSGLLVATATRSPFVSFDDCVTFEDRAAGADTNYLPEYSGGALDESESTTVLLAAADRWVVGGWGGLFVSDDEGLSWLSAEVVPPDFTRAVAFPDPWDGGTVLLGANSAGVIRTFDLGFSYNAPSRGLDSPNVQGIAVEPGDPLRVWAIVGHVLWSSVDGGARWELVDQPFTTVSAITVTESDIWLISSDQGDFGSNVAWSGDRAASWLPAEALDEVLDGAIPTAITRMSDGTWCASGSTWSAVTCGDGPTSPWELLYQERWNGGVRLLALDDDPSTLVLPDAEGIHVSFDRGGDWQVVWEGGLDRPIAAASGDGWLWVATAMGRLLRSEDGVEWHDVGVEIPGRTAVLAPRPDVGSSGEVLLGTTGGMYVVREALGTGAALSRWASYQRADAISGYTHCPACPVTALVSHGVPRDDASLGWAVRVSEGAVLSWALRGRQVVVRGWTDAMSAALVRVNGLDVGVIGGTALEGALFSVELGDEGPHQVEVIGLIGPGIEIDAVEAYGSRRPTGAGAEVGGRAAGGGCAGGDAAALWLVVIAGARRRGRGPGRARPRGASHRPPSGRFRR